MPAPTSVDDYLAGLPDERRAAVEELRRTVRAAAPEAVETIAYSMPAFRSHGGQFLVSFAAFKNHYSLFPASGAVVEALGADLMPYLSGSGTIRFPASRPIPTGLVRRIVEVRVTENAARAAAAGSASRERGARAGLSAHPAFTIDRGDRTNERRILDAGRDDDRGDDPGERSRPGPDVLRRDARSGAALGESGLDPLPGRGGQRGLDVPAAGSDD
jgi:uncharacterized protein YdhG (YjbR/CyaY superfamily)